MSSDFPSRHQAMQVIEGTSLVAGGRLPPFSIMLLREGLWGVRIMSVIIIARKSSIDRDHVDLYSHVTPTLVGLISTHSIHSPKHTNK